MLELEFDFLIDYLDKLRSRQSEIGINLLNLVDDKYYNDVDLSVILDEMLMTNEEIYRKFCEFENFTFKLLKGGEKK